MSTFYMTADAEMYHCGLGYSDELYHYGVLGMKWGVRRYQNKDGSLTKAGRERYGKVGASMTSNDRKAYKAAKKQSFTVKKEATMAGRIHRQTVRELEKASENKKSDRYKDAVANEKFWRKQYKKTYDDAKSTVDSLQKKYGSSRIPNIKSKEYKQGKYIKERIISNKQIAGTVLGTAAILGGAYAVGAEVAPFVVPSRSKMARNYRDAVETKSGFDRFKNRGSGARTRENIKNMAKDIGLGIGASIAATLGLSGLYRAQGAYLNAKHHYPTNSQNNSHNFTLGPNGQTIPENRLIENRLIENREVENILREVPQIEQGTYYEWNSKTGKWKKSRPLQNATYW